MERQEASPTMSQVFGDGGRNAEDLMTPSPQWWVSQRGTNSVISSVSWDLRGLEHGQRMWKGPWPFDFGGPD